MAMTLFITTSEVEHLKAVLEVQIEDLEKMVGQKLILNTCFVRGI